MESYSSKAADGCTVFSQPETHPEKIAAQNDVQMSNIPENENFNCSHVCMINALIKHRPPFYLSQQLSTFTHCDKNQDGGTIYGRNFLSSHSFNLLGECFFLGKTPSHARILPISNSFCFVGGWRQVDRPTQLFYIWIFIENIHINLRDTAGQSARWRLKGSKSRKYFSLKV